MARSICSSAPDRRSKVEPTWLAGVSIDPTATLKLHASATRKVRVPSIDQLYNTSSGNPSLHAEHAYAIDAGADQQLTNGVTATVSVFQTNAHDFIERDSPEPFENHDEYRFRGAELTLQTTRIPRLGLRGGYSFLDSDDIGTGQPLQTRPRHRGMIDWVWTPVSGSAVRGAVSLTGTQLYDSRGSNTVQRKGDGYALVDLGLHADAGPPLRHRLRRHQPVRSAVRSGLRTAARGTRRSAQPACPPELAARHGADMVTDWFIAHDGLVDAGRLPSLAQVRQRISAVELLILFASGAAAAVAVGKAKLGLGIPGHSIVLAALPMVLGMALAPRRFAGSVMSAGALGSAWALAGAGVADFGAGRSSAFACSGR